MVKITSAHLRVPTCLFRALRKALFPNKEYPTRFGSAAGVFTPCYPHMAFSLHVHVAPALNWSRWGCRHPGRREGHTALVLSLLAGGDRVCMEDRVVSFTRSRGSAKQQ